MGAAGDAIFNGIEALLWASIGVVVLVRSRRAAAGLVRLGTVAGTAFVVFGLTDVVEIFTGAWWRPLPLFAAKGVCLLTLLGCLILYCRARRPAIGRADTDE